MTAVASDWEAADRVRFVALTEITQASDKAYKRGYEDAVKEVVEYLRGQGADEPLLAAAEALYG
jgi:hypothetical protein